MPPSLPHTHEHRKQAPEPSWGCRHDMTMEGGLAINIRGLVRVRLKYKVEQDLGHEISQVGLTEVSVSVCLCVCVSACLCVCGVWCVVCGVWCVVCDGGMLLVCACACACLKFWFNDF